MCSGSVNYNRNPKCRKCLHKFVAWMSLRELTDVLTALLFYDFLLSFMLTGCDGCIESDSKRINYFRRSKKILSSFLVSTSKLKSSAWGHLT